MAYQNTGYARNTTLTVTKGDYSQSYNITEVFTDPTTSTSYGSLSLQEFQRLTEAEYQIRLQAFIRHVFSLEDGLENDCPNLAQGSVVYDPDSCPVPTQEQTDQ